MSVQFFQKSIIKLSIAFITMIGYAMTVYGSTTYSIDLDGVDDYVSINDTTQSGLDITGDMTIELWTKLDSVSGTSAFLSKWDSTGNNLSYGFRYLGATNKLSFHTSSNGSTAQWSGEVSQTLTAGIWYHVAAVYDASAGSVEFFVNGSSIGSASGLATSLYNGDATVKIGSTQGGSEWLDGHVDELRVWSDKRTSTEISQNYQVELTGNEANLVAYWRFDDNLQDETSNDNDLTNNGALFSTDTFSAKTVSVRKDGDQSVTSDAVTDNDDDLVIGLSASQVYRIDGIILAKSASSLPDIKLSFVVPTGSTMDIALTSSTTRKAEIVQTSGTDTDGIPLIADEVVAIIVTGTVKTSTTAGTIALQWAQDQSSATATTVLRGSYLTVDQM